ncbi:polysaccharide biosynthesis tyrosine autokinase [Solimonas soli]|uniref:polysaccharide biosynthesis tyrosine autokinase n=1 Tax=Solimonas soli TaxID=413479 RepID=UPI0004B0C6DA|nr:polysaccharide biosynthesis tyrosine autokinase [Solimonas soli]
MNDQNQTPNLTGPLTRDDEEINLRELLDIVWSGKWIVLAITVATTLLSVIYALTAQPIYQADGLVQVEKEKSALGSSVDQLSSLIGSPPTEAPAEIALIKSNMVLGSVIDNLKLYIRVEPNYFPVIGKAIVRRRTGLSAPAPAPLGLRRFAWGGERVRITALDFPENWYDLGFTLTVGQDGDYALNNGDGELVLQGKAGIRASVETPDGPVSIFVQELNARPGTRFTVTRVALQTLLGDLNERLTVNEQPRDSGMLNLQFEDNDRHFSAQFVNAVEDAYLSQNVERRSAQAAQSLDFLKKQLPDLRAKVDEAQAKLNTYKLKKGSVDVQQETQIVLQQSVELETQRLDLMQKRDAALLRYTAQHPVVTSLNQQIAGVEREQESLKKRVATLPETQQEVLSLMRDLDVNTQLYTALLNSAQELQVTKAGTVGNVRIVDRALMPLSPAKPKKKLIAVFGLICGAFIGTMTVFAMRALLRGVDRPEELERVLGLPTYASIPYSPVQRRLMRRIKQKAAEGQILAALDGTELAIEALRSLRTSLHFAMLEAPNNIIMLTGPIAGLGKSFVSINLGAVLALSGKRTIVLDADLRRGHLYKYANTEQKPGISEYITGTAEQVAIIRKTAVQNLDFIAGGTRPPNPSEILMHDRFAQLMRDLSAKYDYVLVDTPPVLPVTDAAIIGRLAGTTMVVLKSAEHPMRAIEETVRRLRQAGVKVRGMIFNQVGARVGSYGYGAYGYAYGYSSYGYKSKPDST